MRAREGLAWVALAAASAVLCHAAWTHQPAPDPPAPPAALPRPPSPAERARVQALLAGLQADLDAASAALGHPPAADQLESRRTDGAPMLASGLPDNPLRPAVAAVISRCPALPQPEDGADWVYCPDSGQVAAVGLDYQARGSE